MTKHENEGKCSSLIKANTIVITEEGTGSCHLYPYSDRKVALKEAESWWCNWVAFDIRGTELKFGGIGFAVGTCR